MMSTAAQLAEAKMRQRRTETERLFSDWDSWIEASCTLVEDSHPHVDVIAVFHG